MDIVKDLHAKNAAGDAAAYARYVQLITQDGGTADDQAELARVMETLGIGADDMRRDAAAARQAIDLAAKVQAGIDARRTWADAAAAVEAQILESERMIAEREAETHAFIVAQRKTLDDLRQAVDAAHQPTLDARALALPELRQLKAQNPRLLESVALADPAELADSPDVVIPGAPEWYTNTGARNFRWNLAPGVG